MRCNAGDLMCYPQAKCAFTHTNIPLKFMKQHNFTLLLLCNFKTANIEPGSEEGLLHIAKYIKAAEERKVPPWNWKSGKN